MNVHRYSSAMALILLALAGCANSSSDSQKNSVPAACKIRGNSADSVICMTSFTSVLADPRHFDGMTISMGAWVESVNDVVIAFPSQDSLQLRDSFSSVVVYHADNPKVVKFLAGLPSSDPKFVRITGVFHWIADDAKDSRANPIDANRVGVMERVDVSL
ncbi:hypothetical protein [Stenotrophomonas sp.]|uniref:hypothetical protein n=1 Tax=Stenotrophomonas sp. TaxID=69392 RepID=UPI0028AACAAD|nr:hypothetical protein [Stenotrophomonas sp.]